jgi:hypothetical protein
MFTDNEIIPGKGIDGLKLGMTESMVKSLLGAPDEQEEFTHSDGDEAHSYYYYEWGLDLTFEEDDGYRLSYISIEVDKFAINGIKVGMDKNEVLEKTKQLGWEDPLEEDVSTDEIPGNELISYEQKNVNFWFVSKKLDEIQIGPFWKDDETPIWPE